MNNWSRHTLLIAVFTSSFIIFSPLIDANSNQGVGANRSHNQKGQKGQNINGVQKPGFTYDFLVLNLAILNVTLAELALNHESNPLLLGNFIEGLSNPNNLLSLQAFRVVNNTIYDYLSALKLSNHYSSSILTRTIPFIGIGVGNIVSSLLSDFLNDPYIKKCALSYLNKDRSIGEKLYCQKLKTGWQVDKKILEITPQLVTLIGSAFTLGLIKQSVSDIALRFRAVPSVPWSRLSIISKRVPVPVISTVGNIADFTAFIGLSKVFNRYIVDPLIIDPWGQRKYGMSISQVENFIIERLEEIIANPNQDLKLVKLRCARDSSCASLPKAFGNLLTHYHVLMQQWRQHLARKGIEAYQNWYQYLINFIIMIRNTKVFYQEFINFVSQPRNVNFVSLRSELRAGAIGKFYKNFLTVTQINNKIIDNGMHPRVLYRADTFKINDYFLASMVCGPSPIASPLEGNLVSDVWGIGITFSPPRIVSDWTRNACLFFPSNVSRDKPKFNIHQGVWKDNRGKKYFGLIDIVVNSISRKENIFNMGFEEFWIRYVQEQIDSKLNQLQIEYQKMLQTLILPALANDDFYFYLGRKFSLGVVSSLRQELKMYIYILQRLIQKDLVLSKELERCSNELLSVWMTLSLDYTQLTRDFSQYSQDINQLFTKVQDIKKIIIKFQKQVKDKDIKNLLQYISDRIGSLFFQLDSYLRQLKMPSI